MLYILFVFVGMAGFAWFVGNHVGGTVVLGLTACITSYVRTYLEETTSAGHLRAGVHFAVSLLCSALWLSHYDFSPTVALAGTTTGFSLPLIVAFFVKWAAR